MPRAIPYSYQCSVNEADNKRYEAALEYLHSIGMISKQTHYCFVKLCLKLGLEEAIRLKKEQIKNLKEKQNASEKNAGPRGSGSSPGGGSGSDVRGTTPVSNPIPETIKEGESNA